MSVGWWGRSTRVLVDLEMMTLDEAAIRPLMAEGLLPGILVWGASFSPFEGTTTCVAVRLLGRSRRTDLQIGASEAIDFTKTIPAWEYEGEGKIYQEPGVTQEQMVIGAASKLLKDLPFCFEGRERW